ncbi:MAG TPA: DinB family protein [Thermoanaerobaculia bacterium]|nr:DinB family protein [Thermoanaerobaculia bacterium]
MGRPGADEAAPYYFKYIDQVPSDDVVGFLATQLDEAMPFLSGISEEKSLHRYAPGKWSIREVLNHINDGERLFVARAFWFARGFDTPLPSFDQEVSVAAGKADAVSWADHVEEFRGIRLATLSFFRNLPAEAWDRNGIASDLPFTVRALAYIAAGHFIHHAAIVRERYLGAA